nr:retrotransposon Orf1 [Tanacetum cinerariifolium]GEW50547.1 retrotransposon Orf1 [Tanacetum cinerariifolium]
MGDANPIHTLGDYSKPSHEGYMNTIELPVGNNVVPLRSDTIRKLRTRQKQISIRPRRNICKDRLGDSKPFDTLVDLGSCVNIIPLYLFKKLNIGLLEETDHIFGLADETKSYLVGIVKDVEVHIRKLKLLNDFYVIDMKKDRETPLLVGRGFLTTANAVIDCRMANIAVGKGITRDAEINPFKDVLVFRRMVKYLGAIPKHLKSNMWESKDLINNLIKWNKPPKNGDGAWHAKIILIDPDEEEFTKTLQSILTTRKLSQRESPRRSSTWTTSTTLDVKGEGTITKRPTDEYFDTFQTRDELTYHKYLISGLITSIFLRNPIIMEGCPSNLRIPCNIRHVHIKKAYIDPNSPLNIMTRMIYNSIMKRKLNPRECSNRGVRNFTVRIKGMHVFIGNFTYVIDFMIVEDISFVIDPRLSQVVLGRPFVEISNMTHDPPEGVVRFTNGDNEVAYKIEQYNSLSNLEKEHTKLVYLRNEEDKRRGV